MDGKTAKALAALRVVLGWGFLYAGLAKFFMIGTTKAFTSAGYLKFGTVGTWPGVAPAAEGQAPVVVNPTHDIWVGLAANASLVSVIDTLVVFGEIAIGVALILGLATRFASVMGAVMMALFTIASWDFGHGLVNETAIYTVSALVLAVTHAGKVYGLDSILDRYSIVGGHTAIRRFAGAVA